MFELIARLGIVSAALVLAGFFGVPDFDVCWKVAALVSAYALFANRLESNGMMSPGVAGAFAVADAIAIGMLIAAAGHLGLIGFLVLVPCAYAVSRFAAQPASMAPLAAASLPLGERFAGSGDLHSTPLLIQAGGILLIGLLLSQRVVTIPDLRRFGEDEREEEETAQEPAKPQEPESEAYLELREKYRQLRDLYQEMERRTRNDRFATQLREACYGSSAQLHERLAEKAKELCGADGAVLYTLAQYGDSMIVQGVSGDVPRALQTAAIGISASDGAAQIRENFEQALLSIQTDERKHEMANVLLSDRGRMVGMLCLTCLQGAIDAVRDAAESLAPHLAALLREETEGEELKRRLKETEVLYEMAATGRGSDTPLNLAARVLRELSEVLNLDHLGVFSLEEDEARALASHGKDFALLQAMSFANGPGIRGWLRTGAPELVLFDVREDSRCPAAEALKRRVGSYCVFPIQFGIEPTGFLAAATHRTGGLDVPEVEMLRAVAAELGQAWARMEHGASGAAGLMTPREFQSEVAGRRDGTLVYLEPLKRQQLLDSYGKPALDHALRQYATRVQARLPIGGALCRRFEGDYVAFLPEFGQEAASRWANHVSALASMIGIRTPDGTTRIPLAIRSKVAPLDPQFSENSAAEAA
jgi:hypothetical protein